MGWDGGEERDSGSGDVGVGEFEVGFDAGGDRVPEIGGQPRGGPDEVEGEFFAHGGGWGGHDLVHGRASDHGGVSPSGRLLEGLQQGAGLTEGVV